MFRETLFFSLTVKSPAKTYRHHFCIVIILCRKLFVFIDIFIILIELKILLFSFQRYGQVKLIDFLIIQNVVCLLFKWLRVANFFNLKILNSMSLALLFSVCFLSYLAFWSLNLVLLVLTSPRVLYSRMFLDHLCRWMNMKFKGSLRKVLINCSNVVLVYPLHYLLYRDTGNLEISIDSSYSTVHLCTLREPNFPVLVRSTNRSQHYRCASHNQQDNDGEFVLQLNQR